VDLTVLTGPDGAWEVGGLLPGAYDLHVPGALFRAGEAADDADGFLPGEPDGDRVTGIVLPGIGSTAAGYLAGLVPTTQATTPDPGTSPAAAPALGNDAGGGLALTGPLVGLLVTLTIATLGGGAVVSARRRSAGGPPDGVGE
jgi:hypothetical protein